MSLIDSIKKHEGLRLKPYMDAVGKITIGYGRNLDDNGITKDEAEDMLRHDIRQAEVSAGQFTWYRKLNRSRKDVIVEMIFNMGLPRVLTFKKMIQALRGDDFSEASLQMLDSKWATQVGIRAETLALKMENGEGE